MAEPDRISQTGSGVDIGPGGRRVLTAVGSVAGVILLTQGPLLEVLLAGRGIRGLTAGAGDGLTWSGKWELRWDWHVGR